MSPTSHRNLLHRSLCVVGAIAMLAGCGATSEAVNPSTASLPSAQARPSFQYELLYSFGASGDGKTPIAGLTDLGGSLYGTSIFGGTDDGGTAFSISPSGDETVLHSFSYFSGDGQQPYAALVSDKGRLFGTTKYGGAYTDGTVFSITTSGTESVLHSFGGSGDGILPYSSLVDVHGRLYGTTYAGGAGNDGTVFEISRSGKERILHSFSGAPDGANPYGGLLYFKGKLYGTTQYGGGADGEGTVFSISLAGKETILHSFGPYGNGDGEQPVAGLTNVKGTLYGTTQRGGAHGGAGTVFSITLSGTESVLYSFGASGDGAYPYAGLVDVKNMLYGTTYGGGAYACSSQKCGTLFSITPSGTETVLHSFGSSGDGNEPYAGLTEVKGTMYGTTSEGGAHGAGTVFAFTP